MNGFIRPELHDPITFCKKGEVAPDADEIAGMVACAPLADNDTARSDLLPAVGLYAQTFRIGISPVSGTALTFCMCHGIL